MKKKVIVGSITTLRIAPTDGNGNPAKVDGVPVWAASDETLATIAVAEDGLSAVVTSVLEGMATVTVTADVAIGEGVKPLSASIDFEIAAAEAVDLNLSIG